MIVLQDIEFHRKKFRLTVPALTIYKGLTLVIGKNGAGKSTLLQLIATALFPKKGQIRYGNETVQKHMAHIRSRIGFVPQRLEIYEEMRVRAFMKYMAQLKGIYDDSQIQQLLQMMDLQHVVRKKIKALSRGVQQRLAIAQALIGKPDILLLDEPLNDLDSKQRKALVRWLREYAEDAVVICSSHELNEWGDTVDHILMVDQGQILFDGAPQTFIRGLSSSVWQGQVTRSFWEQTDPSKHIAFRRVSNDEVVLRMSSPHRPSDAFEEHSPTLEDAYFIRVKDS